MPLCHARGTMRSRVLALLFCAIGFFSVRSSLAQPEEGVAARPRLFLRCPDGCHEEYLHQQLSYFDFVRDRHQADWIVVIVVQESGNGGSRFTVRVEPFASPPLPSFSERPPGALAERGTLDERGGFGEPARSSAEAEPIVREVTSRPGTSVDDQRHLLAQAVLSALYPPLSSTEHVTAFEFSLRGRNGAALSQLEDPWDYWVLAPAVTGWVEAASRLSWSNVEAGFTARRTTEQHRIWTHANYGHQWQRYILEDGNTSRGTVMHWAIQGLYARSLGNHWALGPLVSAARDTYENLRVHVHYGPALEYNFFPYSQNATALLSLTYQAGVWVNWYDEITQSGHLRELRPYQALSLVGDVNQAWGSIQLGLQFNSFIDDPELYRLTGTTVVSLQLFEGFALNLEGEGAWIRDQITLRAEEVSNEEILLGTTQLPSSFDLVMEFSLSYTFGSVHNTIVNPRFGRVTF